MLTAKAAHRKDLSGKPATMTHQHYRMIAATIRCYWTEQGREMGEQVACYFADDLPATNPNFDRERFLAACQPTGDAD